VKVHAFKQYSEEWWEAHRGRPSCSNFVKIITPAKADFSKSAIAYSCELIAELYDPNYGPKDECMTTAMRNGRMMEREARHYYAMDRDVDVQEVGLVETDCGRFVGSPDSLVGDEGGLEIKSPDCKTHIRYLLDGCLPAEYVPQVHGYLHITQRPWWDFESYYRGLPSLIVRVEASDYTRKLGEALEKFWELHSANRRKIEGEREEIVAAAIAGAEPVESYF
jgi:hypothetical protein